jgi:CBS domain-containing protein
VLADDLGPEEPVERILTRPVLTVPSTLPLYDVWARLLDAGVHHLPVTRDGRIVGVVTSGDLLRHTAQGPVAVLRGVERLPGRDGLAGYSGKVAEMVAALAAGRLETGTIAGFVARLNDTLVRRILRWAEEDLGPAPVPYAWIAFGSEGRMEQMLLTDQDNAVVYADAGAEHREYFQKLAERVNADLETAGFPRCAGGYMARSWHSTLSEWRDRFVAWIDSPQPKALLEASIFFDFRRVAGDLPLDVLDDVVARAAHAAPFLRFLARSAMEFRPPASLLMRLRGAESEIDLKLHGISPIVFLARAYALEAGSRARNTLERISVARRAGLIDQENEENVAEAYRFLIGLRLRRQLQAIAEGGQATNKITLAQLTAVERSRLKDSFRAIRNWQDRGTFHFKLEF